MSGTEISFVPGLAPLRAARRLTVSTPFLGRGVLSIGDAGVQVAWTGSRYPDIARGDFLTVMDVTIDDDGRWTASRVSISHADGRPLEATRVGSAMARLEGRAHHEALAAVTEGFLVYPNALAQSLLDAGCGADELSGGVTRVIERLSEDTRSRELAEAVDRRAAGDIPVRARLEDLAASMRESHAPSF